MPKNLIFTISSDKNNSIKVSCSCDQEVVGWAYLKIAGEYLTPDDKPLRESIFVKENFRRLGIATKIYSLAEKKLKKTLIRSSCQSPDAKKLWGQKDRPFGS